MTKLDEMKAQVPLAFDEIESRTRVRPTSIGITRKGRSFAFGVSLPSEPDEPKPEHLFGFPVVYWVMKASSLLNARG